VRKERAYVEETVVGPKLIVGGVEVRRWLGCAYDDEAKQLADKINEGLYEWQRLENISNNDD
jgi:hypothetical protein